MIGLEKGITKEAVRMAWPAVCESFFIALAGMVDSLMVSSMGASFIIISDHMSGGQSSRVKPMLIQAWAVP